MKKIIPLIMMAVFLSSCVSPEKHNMYIWSDYEECTYKHLKSPQEKEKYAKKLTKIIKKGEKYDRVPPGLYAEYGKLMRDLDREEEAVIFFKKEKEKWPESERLMEIMLGGTSS